MTTGLVLDQRFLLHDTGPGHPERPQRLTAIEKSLRSQPYWADLKRIEIPDRDVLEQVAAVHDPRYVKRVQSACINRMDFIDSPDCAICSKSYDVALLAVSGVLAAVDAVMEGSVRNAFCAVRPPGHHAERDFAMGFCLFNNIAIAAQHALSHHGLNRVAIVDFDVHHGNGTQHLFETRPDVLFISLHEDPRYLYPGSGFAHETGRDDGRGFTVNLPLPPGSGDETYHAAFADRVVPELERFDPQFLLISAGFDAAEDDPLAHMRVTPEGFGSMTEQLTQFAAKRCNDRVVSLLEGGYNLDQLAQCVARHVHVFHQAGQ